MIPATLSQETQDKLDSETENEAELNPTDATDGVNGDTDTDVGTDTDTPPMS